MAPKVPSLRIAHCALCILHYAFCIVHCAFFILLAGCTIPANVREGTLRGKSFEVKESSLNWAEIIYTPRADDRDLHAPCRLSLFGSGEIAFRTGRSPRVIDDFSHKVTHPYWNDYYEDRTHIGDEAMREVFQQLVDAGIFFDDWHRVSQGEEPKPPIVRIRAKFDGKETLRTVDNRRVVRIVEDLLPTFVTRMRTNAR